MHSHQILSSWQQISAEFFCCYLFIYENSSLTLSSSSRSSTAVAFRFFFSFLEPQTNILGMVSQYLTGSTMYVHEPDKPRFKIFHQRNETIKNYLKVMGMFSEP